MMQDRFNQPNTNQKAKPRPKTSVIFQNTFGGRVVFRRPKTKNIIMKDAIQKNKEEVNRFQSTIQQTRNEIEEIGKSIDFLEIAELSTIDVIKIKNLDKIEDLQYQEAKLITQLRNLENSKSSHSKRYDEGNSEDTKQKITNLRNKITELKQNLEFVAGKNSNSVELDHTWRDRERRKQTNTMHNPNFNQTIIKQIKDSKLHGRSHSQYLSDYRKVNNKLKVRMQEFNLELRYASMLGRGQTLQNAAGNEKVETNKHMKHEKHRHTNPYEEREKMEELSRRTIVSGMQSYSENPLLLKERITNENILDYKKSQINLFKINRNQKPNDHDAFESPKNSENKELQRALSAEFTKVFPKQMSRKDLNALEQNEEEEEEIDLLQELKKDVNKVHQVERLGNQYNMDYYLLKMDKIVDDPSLNYKKAPDGTYLQLDKTLNRKSNIYTNIFPDSFPKFVKSTLQEELEDFERKEAKSVKEKKKILEKMSLSEQKPNRRKSIKSNNLNQKNN